MLLELIDLWLFFIWVRNIVKAEFLRFLQIILPHHFAVVLDQMTLLSEGFGLFRWLSGKEPTCQCRKHRRHGFDPWVRKISWRRKWQAMPIFFFGQSHGHFKDKDAREQIRCEVLFMRDIEILNWWQNWLEFRSWFSSILQQCLCYHMPPITYK